MKKFSLITLAFSACFLMLLASTAYADSRFDMMDKNADGDVTWEEFSLLNKNMSKTAFEIIDSNKNSLVSHEEWDAFLQNHSRPEGMMMEPAKVTPLPAKSAPDLPAPPKAPTNTTATPVKDLKAPKAVQEPSKSEEPTFDLPLITPPKNVENLSQQKDLKIAEPKTPVVSVPTVKAPQVDDVILTQPTKK